MCGSHGRAQPPCKTLQPPACGAWPVAASPPLTVLPAAASHLPTLRRAAAYGQLDCLHALLAAGAAVEAQDANGLTALALAAGKDRLGCLEALVAAGASLAATCRLGNTPAHIAACNGSLAALRYLAAHGGAACLAARNRRGQTPRQVAAEYCQRAAERRLARLERGSRRQPPGGLECMHGLRVGGPAVAACGQHLGSMPGSWAWSERHCVCLHACRHPPVCSQPLRTGAGLLC